MRVLAVLVVAVLISAAGSSDIRTACGRDGIAVYYRDSADGSRIDGGVGHEGRC